MIESGYLRALVLSLAAWLSLYLIFTWTIDPYGVSPVRLEFPRINALGAISPARFFSARPEPTNPSILQLLTAPGSRLRTMRQYRAAPR
jgi:hypothetical protein